MRRLKLWILSLALKWHDGPVVYGVDIVECTLFIKPGTYHFVSGIRWYGGGAQPELDRAITIRHMPAIEGTFISEPNQND